MNSADALLTYRCSDCDNVGSLFSWQPGYQKKTIEELYLDPNRFKRSTEQKQEDEKKRPTATPIENALYNRWDRDGGDARFLHKCVFRVL